MLQKESGTILPAIFKVNDSLVFDMGSKYKLGEFFNSDACTDVCSGWKFDLVLLKKLFSIHNYDTELELFRLVELINNNTITVYGYMVGEKDEVSINSLVVYKDNTIYYIGALSTYFKAILKDNIKDYNKRVIETLESILNLVGNTKELITLAVNILGLTMFYTDVGDLVLCLENERMTIGNYVYDYYFVFSCNKNGIYKNKFNFLGINNKMLNIGYKVWSIAQDFETNDIILLIKDNNSILKYINLGEFDNIGIKGRIVSYDKYNFAIDVIGDVLYLLYKNNVDSTDFRQLCCLGTLKETL